MLNFIHKCMHVTVLLSLFVLGGCAGSLSEFTTAASTGDMTLISSLLDQGKSVDEKDGLETTALYQAAKHGQHEVVERLLLVGADPNQLNGVAQQTALMAAADAGSALTIKQLIKAGAELERQDSEGNTALYLAAGKNHVEAAQQLLGGGADVNARSAGYTALMLAAQNKSTRMVKLLLAEGADVSLLSEGAVSGYNALYFAVELLGWHDNAGAKYSTRLGGYGSPFSYHEENYKLQVTVDQLDIVDWLLQAGADPDAAEGKWTALTRAARQGVSAKVVEKLLLGGANPDLKSSADWTPLYLASGWNRPEQVQLLLAAGALVNSLNDNENETPVYNAADVGHADVVDMLLAAGANPKIADNDNFTPLYLASYDGYTEVVKSLIAAGAELNTRSGSGGWSPLQTAADKGRKDTLRQLLAAGADVNFKSEGGYSALYYGAKSSNSRTDIVKMLLAAGANPNMSNNGYYPLHMAADGGYYERVETLLKFGAKPNLRDKDNETALDIAKRHGYEKTTAYIQQYGGRTYNYEEKSSSGGNMFGKIFATVAIGSIAASADIPIENSLDVMGAAVNDIWIEDGKGTQLAQMNQDLMQGTYQIKDPALRELAQTRIQMEQQNRELQQQMAKAREEQRQKQIAQQKALAERQRQQQQQRVAYQQQQQQMALERQQRAQAAAEARQQAELERQQRIAEQQAERQRQAELAKQQQQEAAAKAEAERIARAKAEAAKPKPRSGSKYLGRMNTSDSKKVDCDCEGRITKRNLTVGACRMESLTVAYDVGAFMGEPIVRGDYKWSAPAEGETDCLPYYFTIWLKIQNADSYGYVEVNPVVPKAGKVSFSGTASSPNWDNFICSYDGGDRNNCFDSKTAKTLLKKGRIVDFELSHQ